MLAIVGILAGLTLPYFKNQIDKFIVDDFARRVYLFLDHAKTYAIFYADNTQVEMSSDKRTLYINTREDGVFAQIKGRFSKLPVPQGLSIEGTDDPIMFYPNGTCSEFAWDVVYRGSKTYSINSPGFNGKFEINKYPSRNL